MELDHDWHIGVAGWQVGGRHIRLREAIALAPNRRETLLAKHRAACMLLELVRLKLEGELREAEQ